MLAVAFGLALLATAGSPAAAASTLSNADRETGGGAAPATAWTDYTRSGGGPQEVYIVVRNCGSTETRSPLRRTSRWQKVSVTGEVTSRQCTLSLISDAATGGGWANSDDVRFARIGETVGSTDRSPAPEPSGGPGLDAAFSDPPTPGAPEPTTTSAADPPARFGPPGTPIVVMVGTIVVTAIVSTVLWRRRALRPVRELEDSLHRCAEHQRRIVADVAHELRTPVSTVRGYLEALIDGVVPADKKIFEALHDEAMLQQRIVDDLQDLTLAEAGKLTYHRDVLDVAAVLRSCATAADVATGAAGVRLTVRQIRPVQVNADPDRLRQVLNNLLSNAVRHTPAGGRISLDAGPGDKSGKVAVIEFTDTGTGIAPNDLPHVFDRFWRADGDRGHSAGGSGLGLAIARQIIGDHGGTISVSSTLGAGTTFTITLPAVRRPQGGRHRLPATGPVLENSARASDYSGFGLRDR